MTIGLAGRVYLPKFERKLDIIYTCIYGVDMAWVLESVLATPTLKPVQTNIVVYYEIKHTEVGGTAANTHVFS